MAYAIDLSKTFLHLAASGEVEPIPVTRSFWVSSHERGRYDRLVGCVEFSSRRDLHASVQEMHPESDEVIYVVSGSIDVVVEAAPDDTERGVGAGPGEEHVITLDAGQAAIVPRGRWHRLVPRAPGRLIFVNSRSGMQSRPAHDSSTQ